jgi:hypothetical protein
LEERSVPRRSGEQPLPPAQIDHRASTIDHHPTKVAHQGRSDRLGGAERGAVHRVAAPGQVLVGIDPHLHAGRAAELVFEGVLVHDDVHQRHRRATLRGGGPAEDLEDRIRPPLGGGAFQVLDPGVVAVPFAGGGPVGVELGGLEAVEDLRHGRPLQRPMVGLEAERPVDRRLLQRRVPPLMAPLRGLIGPIRVRQRLPLAQRSHEVVVAELGGVVGEDRSASGTHSATRGFEMVRAMARTCSVGISPRP